jgi:hypothetical protein
MLSWGGCFTTKPFILNEPSKKTYTGFFFISALTLVKVLGGGGMVKSGWHFSFGYTFAEDNSRIVITVIK